VIDGKQQLLRCERLADAILGIAAAVDPITQAGGN